MGWAQTFLGAAVAWLIAAFALIASGAQTLAYAAVGFAALFSLVAVVIFVRAWRNDPARQTRKAFDELKKKAPPAPVGAP